jgi:hypothetical protein
MPVLFQNLLKGCWRRERWSIWVSCNCTLAVLRGLNLEKKMVIVLPMWQPEPITIFCCRNSSHAMLACILDGKGKVVPVLN